jgi:MFS family permease
MHKRANPERIFTGHFLWICAVNLMVYGGMYLTTTTLPLYIVAFGTKESEVGFVIASFAASAVISRLIVGSVVDRRGTRVLMILGAGIAMIAVGLFVIANSIPFLTAARFLHGSGVGCVSTAASILVAEIAPASRRGEALGYFGVSTSLAMAVAPALGVVLAESYGFTVMFLAAAGAGLVAVLCVLPTNDYRAQREHTDEHSFLARGWRGLFARSALFPSAILCCFCITYGAVGVFLPLVFEERKIGNPGLFFAVYAVAMIIARAPLGKASDRWGRGVVIAPGLIAMGIALFVLAGASSMPVMLAIAALYGLSVAAMQPALQAMVVDRAVPGERNAAMATFTMAWDLGTGIGCYVWGVVAQAVGFESMYMYASVFGVLGLVGLIAGGGLRRATPAEEIPLEEAPVTES